MFKHPQVEGHWQTLIEGFSTSSQDFYTLVEANLARRELPDLKVSRVEWKEGGFGSGYRAYLRISREHLNFDICAAPFGTGYFFSWWLARIPRIFLDVFFLLAALLYGGFLVHTFFKEGQGLQEGCLGAVLAPVLFIGTFLILGFIVRKGDFGLEPTVLSMPLTGFLYRFVFRPTTYFNQDTANMFRESVHGAVMEAIDAVTSAQGVRGLSEEARRVPSSPKAPGAGH
jgi:hypothetical protein